jgi:uncharacterized membrane protein
MSPTMHEKNPLPRPIKSLPDMRRIGALFCFITSAAGVGVGAYLTLLKFKMNYTPCLTPYGGCQIGNMNCEEALASGWSIFLGLPISLWGSAFYLTTSMLAVLVAIRRDAFGGMAAHIIFALGCFAVLVSAVLGAYTAFALESACPFCVTLYLISVMLLGGAYVTRSPPGERVPSSREILGQRAADLLDAAFMAAFVFILATGVQSMTYHGLRNRVDTQDGCPEQADPLPPSSIKIGPAQPKVIIALFIDMTCPACRREFKALATALRDDKFPEPVQLWIYHTPRTACDPSAFPASYAKSDDEARNGGACLAAIAAECIEKLQMGQGAALIPGMFALHDAPEKDTPLFTPERIGNRAVLLGVDIDPDDPGNELFECINNDQSVLERITQHQRFAEGPGYKVPMVAVYRAIDGAPDPSQKPLFGEVDTPIETIFDYVIRRSSPEAQP